MPTIQISREKMMDILGSKNVIEDEIVDSSRWSIQHSLIFKHEGKVYNTWYQVGATEMQAERAWEYDKTVECTEMQLVEKVVKVWVAVP
jgi:hypothetical protein